MFTTDAGLDAAKVAEGLKAAGVAALTVPRTVIVLEALPVLGSGKTDYPALGRLARERVEA
jgi:acyl-[acyl-carrier-protein]-phospholipid O-acyltransferase/long-chain-fatty-acid--[acyl-carrier-protein] ligase